MEIKDYFYFFKITKKLFMDGLLLVLDYLHAVGILGASTWPLDPR
jgi:hypothetical protein